MNGFGGRYQKAFLIALMIHLTIGVVLALDPSSERPVLVEESKNEMGEESKARADLAKKPDIVKAVSVDEKAVQETIERLKQAKLKTQQQEQAHQAALAREAQQAKQARLAEQKHLEMLKQEEDKIAIAHQKAVEEEQKRVKQLAEQKEKEMKALEELKLQKEALKKKNELEKQMALKKHQKALADKHAAQENAKRTAEQAAVDAAKRARLAGVVDKYKAMILNAISHQWILPENVGPGLSSQFRIRLAPNGAVLEVSLLRSSGDPVLDRSAQTAIYKASPLPVPQDPETFDVFREISLTVRPENLRG